MGRKWILRESRSFGANLRDYPSTHLQPLSADGTSGDPTAAGGGSLETSGSHISLIRTTFDAIFAPLDSSLLDLHVNASRFRNNSKITDPDFAKNVFGKIDALTKESI